MGDVCDREGYGADIVSNICFCDGTLAACIRYTTAAPVGAVAPRAADRSPGDRVMGRVMDGNRHRRAPTV